MLINVMIFNQGHHTIDVCCFGAAVKGSPFVARAYDVSRVSVAGLRMAQVGEKSQFDGERIQSPGYLHLLFFLFMLKCVPMYLTRRKCFHSMNVSLLVLVAEAGEGVCEISITDPNGQLVPNQVTNDMGILSVAFVPTTGGVHRGTVLFNKQNVPGTNR